MFNIIKPNTNFDFVGKQKIFTGISLTLVILSIISLIVFGFNLGIDFKGGSKMIVSFKKDAKITRKQIRKVVEEAIQKITNQKGAEVGVQDFESGAGGETSEVKYLIYTEITSLLNKDIVKKIKQKLKEKYKDKITVEQASEEDKFYLTFSEEVPVLQTYKELRELFKSLNFSEIKVMSQKEEEIDIDFYKQLNLEESDLKKTGAGEKLDWEIKLKEFQQNKKEKILPKLKDTKFTVTIQQLNAIFEKAFKEKFKDDFIRIEQATTVSASVGKHMFNEGLLAILYAIIGILIYITLRFDIRFAPGAVIALIHDVMITMGVFSVFHIKFSLPIIAALLTIVGYSLNDTIVVSDRIRENMQRLKADLSGKLINKSINETLSRTLMTSLTTLIVVISILILGGGLIRNFAFALFVGIVVGTYSSIFIASPIALWINKLLKLKNA